ncbi:MFS transporter [Dictyobacter vulcani]|uniref:MFS transporter n=1 Tax=Dictyobacter vulcani TaxID=2607529 RepID=A0A5J4L2T2_9CHLR|nr:MFS transporter [Dictyobacter vulcani]GER91776.1 MFS transporter [Dictyobacter vulcani]
MTTEDIRSVTPQDEEQKLPFWVNRNFAWLFSGQAISNIGDFVYGTTLLIWVFSLTRSATAVSGVLLAQCIPMFVLGPLAGVFVDRWNRRTTMLVSDLCRTMLALLPLLAPADLRLPVIYSSVFLLSCFGRFFMPAKSGLLQGIVPEKGLMQASSLSQSVSASSLILGPALAAPLYFAFGPFFALAINAASYLVSALCIFNIRAPREVLHPYAATPENMTATTAGSVLKELVEGLKFALGSRILLTLILMLALAMLGGGAINALDVVFVNRNLHAAPAIYGFIEAAAGAGVLGGTLLAALFSKKLQARQLFAGSLFLLGVGIIIYACQSWYITAIILAFVIFAPQGGLQVGFGPIFITNTPREMIGRTQSLLDISSSGASLLSIAIAGYLGQFISVPIIFISCGILISISGLIGWFALA